MDNTGNNGNTGNIGNTGNTWKYRKYRKHRKYMETPEIHGNTGNTGNNGNTGNTGLYNGNTGNNGLCPKGCAADMNNMTKCSTRTSKDGQQYKDCPLSCWSNINVQDKAFCLYDSDCDNCDHVKIPMSSCSLTKNEADCNQLSTCQWENNMCVDDPSKAPPKTKSDAEKKLEELLFLAFLEKKEKEQKQKR